MSEVTDTGYQAESFADRRLRVVTNLRASHVDLAKVTFDADSAEGQVLNEVLEAVTDLDEAGQAAYNAADPAKAADGSAVAIARLRGTQPRAAAKGQLTDVTCNLDAGTYAVGSLVAYVDGEPENRWVNIEEVTSTGTGDYAVDFEAETAGATYGLNGAPYTAPAGQLTGLIATSGWNSVTNATDAAQGRDADTPAQTLKRSEAVQYAPGENKAKSMRGAMLLVDGMIDARVVQGSGTVNPIVWDGTTEDADDTAIADAIWSKLPPGIGTTGALSALTSDGYGVNFDRAEVLRVYVKATVTGVIDKKLFKAAVQAKMPTELGTDVLWADLFVAGRLVPGVVNLDLAIGLSASPTGTDDIDVADLKIANLDSGDITFA